MRRILLVAAAIISTTALAAGPIIWNGANSRDLTVDGLLTPRLTLPENSVVTSADQIIVRAPASITAPWTLTLPPDDGTANYVLITDGSGTTSWVDAQSVVQGTGNTFAGYNAAGDLTSVPGWTYDPANFDGVVVDNTIVPVTGTSGTLNTYRALVNPAATVTNTNWIQTQHEMNVGSGNGADMDDVVGFQANVNFREDSSVDNATGFQSNIDFGENDAITGANINLITTSATIDDQATVTNLFGINQQLSSDAGSQITGATGIQSNANLDLVTGGFTAINSGNTIDSLNTFNGAYISANLTTVGSSVNGYTFAPTITGAMSGSFNGFTASHNLGDTNGVQAFADFGQVDDNLTNSYQSMLVAPTVTVSNGYTSFSAAPSLGTIENGYGFNDGPNITTSVENYTGVNLGGTFTTVTDNWKGVQISPGTLVGDGTGSAVGLGINMAPATGFTAGQVYAIQATGNADIQGRFNAFSSYTPVDGGGNPGSVHGLISAIGVPDNATIANVDTMGVNTAALISLGSNSTITSGGFGLGITALAFPAVLTTETGASADFVNGAVFALSLDPANTGGTVDQVNLARATAIPQGGTQTITELRGYYAHLPAGDPGTTSWGLYSEDFPQNFMEGSLRLGGTPGTSDTTTAKLQVQGNVLLQNASGSQPQLILSEDPDNGTNTTTIQAAASISDYTLTLPDDDGTTGQALTTDGSGVLDWTSVLTDPTTTRGDLIRRGAASLERLPAATDNRVVRGDGTDVVSGQIDDPAFFTSGAVATSSLPGLVPVYEVNTFTPNLTKASGAGTLDTSGSTITARYVRIGNLCFVDMLISPFTVTVGTVALQFTLPFASNNTNRATFIAVDVGAAAVGRISFTAASSTASIDASLSGGLWGVSAANSSIRAMFSYEVD